MIFLPAGIAKSSNPSLEQHLPSHIMKVKGLLAITLVILAGTAEGIPALGFKEMFARLQDLGEGTRFWRALTK